MKNLKKVLALVLAFACAFTMFAGAASFTDEADISENNRDAVELLTTLKIIKGYEDGSFDPEGTVDRAEMAKMIYTIRNGGNDNASAHVGNTTSFTDISGHWAEGYIKYLQNTGIVAGKSATQFAPDAQVTTAEAMKMALALAGYDEKNAGLTGIDWQKNTLTYATTIGLTDNVASAMNAGCTRQDAAQIMANCLSATAVRYSSIVENFVNDSENGLSWGGDPISVGRKWMDLWTNVGTLVGIQGGDLRILMNSSDKTDSDDEDIDTFENVGTDYSDLLGQKVKVLFNDGKNNEVIGVYAIPDNNVTVVNQNEIDVDAAKIVIGDTRYEVENDGVAVIRDGDELDEKWVAGDFKDERSADVVTLIDTDDNSKIDAAYIKTVDVQKVSYVSSSQIIAGSKTYRFEDDTIADGVAKDDWVIITKNLFNENNDVEIAEMATGTVDATREKGTTNNKWKQFQIEGNWYNESDEANRDINTNVKPGVEADFVAVNGIVFYAAKTTTGVDKLEDVLFVAYHGKDGLTNDQARVMFPNGDKATINLKNDYVVNQDGVKSSDIADGVFYEYNKSGDTYELIELFYEDDFYGDYTARGNATLASNGTVTYTYTENGTKTIADTADVIVWSMGTKSGSTNIEFKHITGKQLKYLISGSTPDLAIGDGEIGKLDEDLRGAFTSDVDGLNRASVVAVRYNSTTGELPPELDDISSSANYGFITEDAVDAPNGMIKFSVWTGEGDGPIEVYAEKARETSFTKGTIVGYTAIETEDDRNVMTDAVAIENVYSGSITSANSAGDSFEAQMNSNVPLPSDDLDDYSTVLFVNSKTGEGFVDGKAEPATHEEVGGENFYATNFLVFGREVIVIDVNEVAGHRYDDVNIEDAAKDLSKRFESVEWLNTRTEDTDKTGAYAGAMMRLSFYASESGKLTITGMQTPDLTNAKNVDNNTVELTYKAGKNTFESLIVTGDTDPLKVTFAGEDDTTTTNGNIKVTADANMQNIKTSINAAGDVIVAFDNPGWVNATPRLAAATIRISGIVGATGTPALSADDSQIIVTFSGVNATESQNIEVTLAGLTAEGVKIRYVGGADYSVDPTSAQSVSSTSAENKTFELVVPAGVDALDSVTYSVAGLATAADNKEYTKANPITTGGTAASIQIADKNIQAAGNDYVTVTIKSVGTETMNNAVTYTGNDASKVDTAGSTKTVTGAGTLSIKTVADAKAAEYRLTYKVNGRMQPQLTQAATSGVATFTTVTVDGTKDVEVEIVSLEITKYVLALNDDGATNAAGTITFDAGKASVAVGGEAVSLSIADNSTPVYDGVKNVSVTFKVLNGTSSLSADASGVYTATSASAPTNGSTATVALGTITPNGNGVVTIQILTVAVR